MSKKHDKGKYIYTCPYCGNVAPFVTKYPTIRCYYCKSEYDKTERIKVKA